MGSAHEKTRVVQRFGAPGAHRAFTLTELLVAIGAVALLTLGIGQIFKSISTLVGTGSAVAEVDQLARAIEMQLRDDFAGIHSIGQENTFFGIRGRRIGDVNHNGVVDGNERAIYLTPEDREADRRDGLDPYEEGSRAITTRLDEVVFLAEAGPGKPFTSYQFGPDGTANLTATHARIYYGHGLRPAPDPNFDPESENIPERQWYADGDFGQRAGETNRFRDLARGPAGSQVTGRNEYAGDFVLLRQPLLLLGGEAAGFPPGPGQRESVITNEREYAVYVRDWDATHRIVGIELVPPGPKLPTLPNPTLMRYGRTDLCAQSLESTIAWMEGASPFGNEDATAFREGILNFGGVPQDVELYQRFGFGNGTGTPSPSVAQDIKAQNLKKLQTAVVGCFTRLLCESEPPAIDRGGPNSNSDDPTEALMDTHAVFASRCSRFEVAWNDGSIWLKNEPSPDWDNDGRPDYKRGDVIWFDFNLTRWRLNRSQDTAGRLWMYPRTNPEIPHEPSPQRDDRLEIGTRLDTVVYDLLGTGAAENARDEYLALWGFREPAGSDNTSKAAQGEYLDAAWQKPQLVRFRMTLHDSQYRIKGGKTYEFIVSIE